MPGPRKIQVIAAFAALYLIWGSTYLAILFAIQSIPPFLMAGARFLRDCPDLYHFARLVVRHDSPAGTNCLGRTGRRILGRRNSAGSCITTFRQWSSRDWDVDLALVVVHLVGGFALFAHRKACRVAISGRCPTNVLRRSPFDAGRIVRR